MVSQSLISNNQYSSNLKCGTAFKNGNGSTTAFTIAHGLSVMPANVTVGVGSSDALGEYYVTWDATNITITFAIPPPSGTNNLVFNWAAMSNADLTPSAVPNFNRGTAYKSGDAVTKVFQIIHGFANTTPQAAFVEFQSDDAKGSPTVTWDATYIIITYPIAPPSGTNNLIFSWLVI